MPILQQAELAFQLPEGRQRLRIRVDGDVSGATIHDDQVAVSDRPQDPPHARYGGNASAAGDDRGMARLAARLGDDPRDLDIPQCDDLRREQFVGDDDQRSGHPQVPQLHHVRRVGTQADDDVTNVVHPLDQVGIGRCA